MSAEPAPTPAPAKPPKTKRKDAYIARVTISIPLDPLDRDAYNKAVDAIDGLAAELPTAATVEFTHRGLGKI